METASEEEEKPRAQREARLRSTVIWIVVIAAIFIIGRLTPFAPVQRFFGSFTWLTEQAVEIVSDLFENHGYLISFLGPLLENTLFVGAIIPGTLVMLLAGVAAQNGLISYWPVILLGIAGAIIGDTISYGFGRFGRQRLGPESRIARWAERMREPLMRHSLWLVLSYHFAGYSRLVGPAAAGFLRMPLPRWMLLDYIGVILWVLSFVTGGYVLAAILGLDLADASSSDRNVQIFEIILFAFFAIAILSIMRATRGRRRETADAATDEETSARAGEERSS